MRANRGFGSRRRKSANPRINRLVTERAGSRQREGTHWYNKERQKAETKGGG